MHSIVLARTVNTLIRTRVKRWHFLQGARRALWTQITAIKSSGMDTNWDSTLQKLSIPPFLWKPGMGKLHSGRQAPSSPAFKIGPEGYYVFYIVLHLNVVCPQLWISKKFKFGGSIEAEHNLHWFGDGLEWLALGKGLKYVAVKLSFLVQYTQ